MCLHLPGLENKSRKQEHSCTQRWARTWRRSQPLTQIKAADERRSLNPDQMENRARVLLEFKKKKTLILFLLISPRAEPLMNTLHQWQSFKTCFALSHMLITSAEDVDPFLCFLQSGRTCKLDVCARGRRRSDFMRLEPKFSLSGMLQRLLSVPQTFLLNMASYNQRWRWLGRENMPFPFRGEAEHAFHRWNKPEWVQRALSCM